MLGRYPTTRIIYDRRKQSSKLKTGTVEIEISFEGKRKWISTGVHLLPDHWKESFGAVGFASAFEVNMRINALHETIKTFINQSVLNHESFSWSGLKQYMDNKKSSATFIDFIQNTISKRKDIKESTKRNHRKLLNALKEFKIIVSFEDLTRANIIQYDQWLRSRMDYTQSTIHSYHKFLKIYVNEAIRQEMLHKNPYIGYKVSRGKSKIRKYLTSDEVQAIETADIKNTSLSKVRDLFLFQCYTGLSYADMYKFDFRKTIERNGRKVIHDVRQKTGEEFYIVLLPKAMEILDRYDYHLPTISNAQYNLRLKLVADYARIDKNLTSHMGRHTYATLCLNSGVKIEVLAQMMGHSDIKTTQIYAKMVNSTVEDAYAMMERNELVKTMLDYLNAILELIVICRATNR